jgi:hypothetical protein
LNTPNGFSAHSKHGVSATEGYVPDHFLDLVADAMNEDESLLDVAVDRLAAANKRVARPAQRHRSASQPRRKAIEGYPPASGAVIVDWF